MFIEPLILIFLLFFIIFKIIFSYFFDEKDREIKKIKVGTNYLRIKDFDLALFYFDNYLILHPKAAYAYLNRGKCHIGMKNYEAAFDDFNKVNSFRFHIPEAFFYKSISLYKLGQPLLALKEIEKSIRHLKKEAAVYRWRGLIRLKLNQTDKAIADFKISALLGDEDANFYLLHHYLIEF